mmetsp:Transcript_39327/g.34826  ORF Transcript_39327/g.34826 Transcript_39327/m.34826 type:complete len:167 (-) Transcript_39327:31-531(-)
MTSNNDSNNENNTNGSQLTQESILKQKQELNKHLNDAMSQLYERFGNSQDPKIQQMVQSKLNELKMMVGQIEKNAKQQHVKVDMICDQKQKQVTEQEKVQHTKVEQDKQELQQDCTQQFKQWMQQSQMPQMSQKQTAQSLINSNKMGDIVIKCSNNANNLGLKYNI